MTTAPSMSAQDQTHALKIQSKEKKSEIIGMDIYYLKLRCISKRVVSCYEELNQVR